MRQGCRGTPVVHYEQTVRPFLGRLGAGARPIVGEVHEEEHELEDGGGERGEVQRVAARHQVRPAALLQQPPRVAPQIRGVERHARLAEGR